MKKLLLAGIVALSAIGITAASASIPAPDGMINGCYVSNPPARLLVIRDSTETCPTGTTSLDWNQAGPPGPAGPAGPAGAPGPQGPAGFTNAAHDQSTFLTIPINGWTTVSTATLTLAAPHSVLLIASMDNSCGPAKERFLIDGAPVINGGGGNPDSIYALAYTTISWVVNLTAGAHTISSQAAETSGSGCYVTSRTLTALDLGS